MCLKKLSDPRFSTLHCFTLLRVLLRSGERGWHGYRWSPGFPILTYLRYGFSVVCTEMIRNDLKFHEESPGLKDRRWALGLVYLSFSHVLTKPDLSLNDEFCYPQRLGGWVAAGPVIFRPPELDHHPPTPKVSP